MLFSSQGTRVNIGKEKPLAWRLQISILSYVLRMKFYNITTNFNYYNSWHNNLPCAISNPIFMRKTWLGSCTTLFNTANQKSVTN